ncbi:MAG: HyaD/HybD family hydrogenase maturation endopeptidase [Gammaproteobacteria bacterium]
MNRYVVLAIGNILLSDDGVGAKVLEKLQLSGRVPLSARLVDGGTLGFALAAELEDCAGLVVVDASHMSAPAGTVCRFAGDAMDVQLSRLGRSVHEVGLADAIDIARLTDQLPRRRLLIGIEPATTDWGEELSPAVEAAVPDVVELVIDTLNDWRRSAAAEPELGASPQPASASRSLESPA